MKRKLFWTTFLTLIAFTLIIFFVDRFYFLSQIESHAQRELETIASTIIASDLSLDVLNKFETTDDIIRDLIDDERIDRTIRIFTPAQEMVFSNELGRSIVDSISSQTWSEITVNNHRLKRLTLTTGQYTLEVGLFLDTQINQTKALLNQISIILALVVVLASIIAYYSTRFTMRPLNQLGHFFVNYNQRHLLNHSQDKLAEEDRKALELLAHTEDEVSVLAKNLLSFLNQTHLEQAKKNQDLSFLAHELKTPLSHIFIELETLQKQNTDPQSNARIARLLSLNHRLSLFIKDYLRVASVRSSVLESLQLSAVKVDRLIKTAVGSLSTAHQQRVKIAIDNEMTVLAESHHLESLIVNLISNALKYSQGEVIVRLMSHGLTVIDAGEGFSAATLQQMGRPFNRSNSEESTGLGLTYCFEICRLYNWSIEHRRADSKTEMTVTFNTDSIL